MFESYTEAARRLIYFARVEAGQEGSPYIEVEHLGLALVKEANGIIRSLLSPDLVDALERELRATLHSNGSVPPERDIPLSPSMKRVLADSAKVAEKQKSPHIGPKHVLLALLNQTDLPTAHILDQYGITRERVLGQLG